MSDTRSDKFKTRVNTFLKNRTCVCVERNNAHKSGMTYWALFEEKFNVRLCRRRIAARRKSHKFSHNARTYVIVRHVKFLFETIRLGQSSL